MNKKTGNQEDGSGHYIYKLWEQVHGVHDIVELGV